MYQRYKALTVELWFILTGGVIVYVIAGHLDFFEAMLAFLERHEEYEVDELIVVSVYLVFALFAHALRRLAILKKMTQQLRKKNDELVQASNEIKKLKEIIPICMHCKKIRDGSDNWVKLERYISSRTNSRFSHGVCPDCVDMYYSEYADDDTANG